MNTVIFSVITVLALLSVTVISTPNVYALDPLTITVADTGYPDRIVITVNNVYEFSVTNNCNDVSKFYHTFSDNGGNTNIENDTITITPTKIGDYHTAISLECNDKDKVGTAVQNVFFNVVSNPINVPASSESDRIALYSGVSHEFSVNHTSTETVTKFYHETKLPGASSVDTDITNNAFSVISTQVGNGTSNVVLVIGDKTFEKTIYFTVYTDDTGYILLAPGLTEADRLICVVGVECTFDIELINVDFSKTNSFTYTFDYREKVIITERVHTVSYTPTQDDLGDGLVNIFANDFYDSTGELNYLFTDTIYYTVVNPLTEDTRFKVNVPDTDFENRLNLPAGDEYIFKATMENYIEAKPHEFNYHLNTPSLTPFTGNTVSVPYTPSNDDVGDDGYFCIVVNSYTDLNGVSHVGSGSFCIYYTVTLPEITTDVKVFVDIAIVDTIFKAKEPTICGVTTPTTTISFGIIQVNEISTGVGTIQIDVPEGNKDVIGYYVSASDWIHGDNDAKLLDNEFIQVYDTPNTSWVSLDNKIRVNEPTAASESDTFQFRINLEGQDDSVLSTLTPDNVRGKFNLDGICHATVS